MIAARWAAFALALAAISAIAFLTVSAATVILAVCFALAFGLFVATFIGRPAASVPFADPGETLLRPRQMSDAEMAEVRARWRAVSGFFDQDDDVSLSRLDRLDGVGSRRPSN